MDYVNSNDLEDRDLSRHLLGQYADTVIQVMASTLEASSAANTDMTTFWFVGHAIYLPAAVLGVSSLVNCKESGIEIILSSNTKEAEGYLIDLQNSEATYLARPSTGSS